MTPENRAVEIFYDLHRPLFESLLLTVSGDEQRWAHRIKTFESAGLLDFHTASNLKPKPVIDQYVEDENGERIYAFRESQLDEPKWKRSFIRKVKAPRPSKWTRHRLQLHRDQVQDPKYREDIAKVLAYKWANHLEPENVDVMYMKLMDVAALEHILDRFPSNQINTANVNDFLMRRFANELLDKNEKFQALMDRMKAEIAPIKEQFYAEIRQITAQIRAESDAAFAAIAEESRRRADIAIEAIRARAAEQAERDAAFAATMVRSDEDPEVAFRRTVDESIARQKEERKREARLRRSTPGGFALWLMSRAAMVAVPVGLAFFMEFGESGTTLVEFLTEWWQSHNGEAEPA
jgi:hypothetical protein